jgi:hypothetical protein
VAGEGASINAGMVHQAAVLTGLVYDNDNDTDNADDDLFGPVDPVVGPVSPS